MQAGGMQLSNKRNKMEPANIELLYESLYLVHVKAEKAGIHS